MKPFCSGSRSRFKHVFIIIPTTYLLSPLWTFDWMTTDYLLLVSGTGGSSEMISNSTFNLVDLSSSAHFLAVIFYQVVRKTFSCEILLKSFEPSNLGTPKILFLVCFLVDWTRYFPLSLLWLTGLIEAKNISVWVKVHLDGVSF